MEAITINDFSKHSSNEKIDILKELIIDLDKHYQNNPIKKDSKVYFENLLSRLDIFNIQEKESALKIINFIRLILINNIDSNIVLRDQFKIDDFIDFIKVFNSNISYDEFISLIHHRMLKFQLPLRRREYFLIKNAFLHLDFLKTTVDNNPRIIPPDEIELVKYFGFRNKKTQTVRRAKNVLYNYDICHPDRVFLHPAKIGFTTVLTTNSIPESLSKFIFWSIPFASDSKVSILCIPAQNVDSILKGNNIRFEILDNLFLSYHLNYNEDTNTISVSLPDFSFGKSSLEEIKLTQFNLAPNAEMEFTNRDIKILKSLTKVKRLTDNNSIESINKLSELTIHEVISSLKTMVVKDVFQLIPELNYMGFWTQIFLYFNISNQSLSESFFTSIFHSPQTIIFNNSNTGIGLAYLKLPPYYIAEILDKINEFNGYNQPHFIIISNPLRSAIFTSCFDLSIIDFQIKLSQAELL